MSQQWLAGDHMEGRKVAGGTPKPVSLRGPVRCPSAPRGSCALEPELPGSGLQMG